MSHISLDFETFYSKKLKYGLKQLIAEDYCRHELFDCYLLSACNGPIVWAGAPGEFNWESVHGAVVVSHNRYFDNTVFNELQRRNLIPAHVKPAAWHCTANLTSYLCNRRALAEAVLHLYKTKVGKDYRDIMDNAKFADLTEAQRTQVVDSGKVDAYWAWKLWEDYGSQWPEHEQILSNITIDQGMHGVQIDTALLDSYILQTHDVKHNTEKIIPWLRDDESEDWDDFNCKPTSTKCIAEQCRRMGIPCPPTKSEDEEGYEEWELQYAKQHPWIKAVSAWRSINKLYCTFLTVKRRLRSDGTMPFALKYFGAHTGRWSGDAKINFQNMRKKPMLVTIEGTMESDDIRVQQALDHKDEHGVYPDWVKHAIDFRALIIPRPGKKMIACDLSQIEPRVLAYISGNSRLLKLIQEGYGVYEAFAVASMGYTGPRFDRNTKKTDWYKMIKIQVLGLGYGAGWEKFIAICAKEGGIDITKDDPEFEEIHDLGAPGGIRKIPGWGKKSREIVKTFREQNPLVFSVEHNGLSPRLDSKLRSSVGEDFKVTLPSGRVIFYRDVRLAVEITKDPVSGRPIRKNKATADVGGKRKTFYGGKLVENIVQATAREVFARQLVEMHKRGWWNLFSVHDEAVLEVDLNVTAKDVEEEMSKTPDWLVGCPIAAEGKELQHYEK